MIKKQTFEELLTLRKTTLQYKQTAHFPVSVLLNNIRSMYNVGSIFRTCDAANIQELILTGFTPSPPRKEIDKTALGATESVSWHYEPNITIALQKQKALKKQIIAVELTNKSKNYTMLSKITQPICLILGNELTGIDNEVLQHCDAAVEIPMLGVKHSLNVGVAAGIAIFEAIKAFDNI